MYCLTIFQGGIIGVLLSCIVQLQLGIKKEIPYREIGESYKIVRVTSADPVTSAPVTDLYHQYNPMTIREGDVYFRRHALNFPINQGGGYQSIINEEGASIPIFTNFLFRI